MSEANNGKYALILRQEGALELLWAWDLNRHIDDKLRNCNAAFVRAGKQALEDAKQAKLEAKKYESHF